MTVDKRLRQIYYDMKQRCYNSKRKNYKDYGGRGITICDEWLQNSNTFYEWALTNGYSDDLTIDRIDNHRGYSPENCRWATQKQQSNNKRSSVLITYKGKTQTVAQWAEEYGHDVCMLRERLFRLHWSIEKALNTKRTWEKQLDI